MHVKYRRLIRSSEVLAGAAEELVFERVPEGGETFAAILAALDSDYLECPSCSHDGFCFHAPRFLLSCAGHALMPRAFCAGDVATLS